MQCMRLCYSSYILYIVQFLSLLVFQVPPKLLIQVPRFGKQFKTFEKVVPTLTLNIADIVDIPCARKLLL